MRKFVFINFAIFFCLLLPGSVLAQKADGYYYNPNENFRPGLYEAITDAKVYYDIDEKAVNNGLVIKKGTRVRVYSAGFQQFEEPSTDWFNIGGECNEKILPWDRLGWVGVQRKDFRRIVDLQPPIYEKGQVINCGSAVSEIDKRLSKGKRRELHDQILAKDKIVGSWKADIDKTKELPEVKEYSHLFELGNDLYPVKWTRVEITDTYLILNFGDGRRIREKYKVISQKGNELHMELGNSSRDIFKFKVLDETHIRMLLPNGLAMVFRVWDKSKETEQKDPEQQAFLIKVHNSAATSDLKNAFTAQCAYLLDHMTYAKSIEAIKEAGYSPSEGVNLSILIANETSLIMGTFHDKGDRVFIVNQGGESVSMVLTPSP